MSGIFQWIRSFVLGEANEDTGEYDHFQAVEFSRRRAERLAALEQKARPELQENASYDALELADSDIEALPNGIRVRFQLNLSNCVRLRRLPDGLTAGALNLTGCTGLESLPEGLNTSFLDLSGCSQLFAWPKTGCLNVGRLRARNCTGFTSLPPWLGRIAQLDLAGCANLSALPDGLQVASWIDVADTGIRSLPPSLQGVGLRWRGLAIDERIAFRPEEITAAEVLAERNAELRRVKLERMGYERFFTEANPTVLDVDADRGGERRLFRVELENDEPLVCVSVGCPSTGRRYLLRVPPDTATCRQAIAWTAGFDNPDDYAPLVET